MAACINCMTKSGNSIVGMSLKPRRMGIRLRHIQFSFWDYRDPKRFWLAGKRRHLTKEIRVCSLKKRQEDDSLSDNLTLTHTKTHTESCHDLEIYPGKSQQYQIEIYASDSLKNWSGFLGMQVQYSRAGVLDMRNVHTSVFVKQPTMRLPRRYFLKKIQRAEPIPSSDDN